jgi:hypothetical protein
VSSATHTVLGTRVPVAKAERIRKAAEAEDRTVSNWLNRAAEHELKRVGARTDRDEAAATRFAARNA